MDKEKIEARLDSYLEHCQYEKALNAHTLKAYKKDINRSFRASSKVMVSGTLPNSASTVSTRS